MLVEHVVTPGPNILSCSVRLIANRSEATSLSCRRQAADLESSEAGNLLSDEEVGIIGAKTSEGELIWSPSG